MAGKLKTYTIEEVIDETVSKGDVPGMQMLVRKKDNDIFYYQAGLRNVEENLPFDRDTILRLYSMSKPITGFAAMVLLDRGYITLGEPVERYIPEFAQVQVWDKETRSKHTRRRPVYIKDLLCMTAGLCYPTEEEGFVPGWEAKALFDELIKRLHTDHPMNTIEFAKRTAIECSLAFEPGSGWLYGTEADVMGAVIEIVTGSSLSEFLHEILFDSLEMRDTDFYCAPEKRRRLAVSYITPKKEENWERLDFPHLGIKCDGMEVPRFQSGGAGLYTTLDDYARFAAMLLNGGEYKGKRYLSKEMLRFFTGGGLTPWQREHMWRTWDSLAGYDYGNFMRVATGSGMGQHPQWAGEYGWDGWLGTFFMNVPEKSLTVTLGVQVNDGGGLSYTQRLRNLLLSDPRI